MTLRTARQRSCGLPHCRAQVNRTRGADQVAQLGSRLRWDHGLEFAAAAVEHAALAVGIDVDPATPYAPHEKGKIERYTAPSATASSPGCPRGRAGRVTTAASSRRRVHHWPSPSWWPALTPGCAPTTPSGRTAASVPDALAAHRAPARRAQHQREGTDPRWAPPVLRRAAPPSTPRPA